MAIDTTLIKGAAQASAAREQVAATAVAEMGKSVGGSIVKAAEARAKAQAKEIEEAEKEQELEDQKREAATTKWYDHLSTLSDGLSTEAYGNLTKDLKEAQGRYTNGDAQARGEEMMNLNRLAKDYGSADALFKEVKELDKGGHISTHWGESDEGADLKVRLTSPPEVNKETGVLGYWVDQYENGKVTGQKFLNVEQAGQELKSHLLNTEFHLKVADMATAARAEGKGVPKGETQKYSGDDDKNSILSLIRAAPNPESLIYDAYLDNPFIEDLRAGLVDTPYSALGLDGAEIMADGEINADEAETIANALKENPELLEDTMVDYYLKHVENNFNAGLANRPGQDPNYSKQVFTQQETFNEKGESTGFHWVVTTTGAGNPDVTGTKAPDDTNMTWNSILNPDEAEVSAHTALRNLHGMYPEGGPK